MTEQRQGYQQSGKIGEYNGAYVYSPYGSMRDYANYDLGQVGRYYTVSPSSKGEVEPKPTFTADSYVKLELAVLTAGDVTVAQLTSPSPHYNVFRGSAKRHGDDKEDASIGGSLAVARALREYADALEREALKKSRK